MRLACPPALPVLALLAALGSAACGDAAQDGSYEGERLRLVEGELLVDPAFPVAFATPGRVGAGLLWSGPTGERFFDTRAPVTYLEQQRFQLDIHAPPPDRFLRDAATGRVAVAQIAFWSDDDVDGLHEDGEAWLGASELLVAWSSDGASGGLVLGDLPAGISLVHPSVGCDVRPLELAPIEPGHEGLDVHLYASIPQSALFAAPDCADRLGDADRRACPLAATRWWCRNGPRTGALCDACEYRLFPEDADDATCEAWYARCLVPYGGVAYDESECRAERLVCEAHEPHAAPACDLSCACQELADFCRSTDVFRGICAATLPGCDWQAPE